MVLNARCERTEVLYKRQVANLVLHREFALALGDATEGVRVAEHVVQSDFGDDRELVFADFAVDDVTPASIDAADDRA
jgi:hypothetical protein